MIDRDTELDDRQRLEAERVVPERDGRCSEPESSRAPEARQLRGYQYQISPAELETLREIGRFRTVVVEDLTDNFYAGRATEMKEDLRSLRNQGLVQLRTAWSGGHRQKLPVVVLTKLGKEIAQESREGSKQVIYAGFVKPGEVAHDAAI